jgi:hypothetical protein
MELVSATAGLRARVTSTWAGFVRRSSSTVEGCHEFARLGIDVDDMADVAVVDFFAVIIFDLHNLIGRRKRPSGRERC